MADAVDIEVEPAVSGRTPVSGGDEALGIGRQVLTEAREELARADNKAALLLAAIGVVAGALLAALLAQSWSPAVLSDTIEWLWWVGVIAVLAAIGALASAVYPRTTYRGAKSSFISFFGDVVATTDGELEGKLEATAAKPRKVLIDQLIAISHIVDQKYRRIQFALWALVVGGVACLVSVLINLVLA